jgi:hypothetical protein
MLEQTKTIRRSGSDGKSVSRFEAMKGELRPPTEKDNVVPLHGRVPSYDRRLRALTLAELKAQNAALRNLAVELALEIRDLYGGKRRLGAE